MPTGYTDSRSTSRSTFADDLAVIREAGIPLGVAQEHWEPLYVLRRTVLGSCRRFDDLRPAVCPPPTTSLPWWDHYRSLRRGPRRKIAKVADPLVWGLWPEGRPCPLNRRRPRRTAGDYADAEPMLSPTYPLVLVMMQELLARAAVEGSGHETDRMIGPSMDVDGMNRPDEIDGFAEVAQPPVRATAHTSSGEKLDAGKMCLGVADEARGEVVDEEKT